MRPARRGGCVPGGAVPARMWLPVRRGVAAPRIDNRRMSDPLLVYRREFPILERTTYLVSNSLGAMPRTVAERLAEYVDAWATLGVRAWAKQDGWWDMPVRVRDEIAPLIGAEAGEVVMVPNVTAGQAAVLSALDYSSSRNR